MIDRVGLSGCIIILPLLSACGSEQSQRRAENQIEANSSNNAATTEASPGNSTITPAIPAGALSGYVGKHPSDAVDGARFLDEPMVVKAVEANVPDAAVRKFIFGYDGPDAPIVAKAGRILAWGCERHNCGYHNWSIAITPNGASAEICYYRDKARPDGPSTWYLPNGRTEQRSGNCPSE